MDETALAVAGRDEAAAHDVSRDVFGRTMQRFRGAVSLQLQS